MASWDKRELIAELRARVDAELTTVRGSQRSAQEGATHEETRQEDPKDTRAIEAQYVSRGLAERVEELQNTLAALARLRIDAFNEDDPIAASALVGLQDNDQERVYLIVPVAGGETLSVDAGTVQTLTPGSPLGAALLGNCVGDDVEVQLPGRVMRAEVEWVL